MGNFNLPIFQYIINNDEQIQLYGDNGTGAVPYTAGLNLVPTNANHKFSPIGEMDWVRLNQLVSQDAALRINKETHTAGSAHTAEWDIIGVVPTSPVEKGQVFRLITDNPNKLGTAYQNIPNEKRYQFSITSSNATELVVNVMDVINSDKESPVIAEFGTGGTVRLTNKELGVISDLYMGTTPDGDIADFGFTSMIITTGSVGINNYATLKNLQFNSNVDFDRSAAYYPEVGAQYTSFAFQIKGTELPVGGHTLPSQVPGEFVTEFIFYIKEGLVAEAAFNALEDDVNI